MPFEPRMVINIPPADSLAEGATKINANFADVAEHINDNDIHMNIQTTEIDGGTVV